MVDVAYEARKKDARRRNAESSLKGRDIAEDYPPEGNLERRAACSGDFRLFCETYFPNAFRLAWGEDHLLAIGRMQDAVLNGGLFALAMPRGSGKTTLCLHAAMWSLLYGHRRFVCLIAATQKRAGELLQHIKTALFFNDLLAEDHRQVCYPIRRLENNARRAIGQLFDGEQTLLGWSADRITLPTMPDDACDGSNVSGSTVTVAGLTGSLRGQSSTLARGEILRPELVILDDPQTRESALSMNQSIARAAIVNGDVLGMAGPGRKIAAIMPCTIIRSGDMADVLLDRQKSPRWKGERTKMLNTLPANEKLWERYDRIRAESFRAGGSGAEATEFYREHQEAMDSGAVAAWPARHHDDELSAIQHAMNLRGDDVFSFAAEYQNEPLVTEQGEGPALFADRIAGKLNGVKRGIVPVKAEHITAFIDVHDALLYWVAVAWSADFTGWVVDYGTWPDQHQRYFTLRRAARTMSMLSPGAGREGSIRAGLVAMAGELLSREWEREDGAPMRVERCLVDAGYVPDVVYDVCRHSPHAAVLMPSRGIGIGASGKPISEYNTTTGDRIGFNWYIPKPSDRQAMRHFRYDANFWKSFLATRLSVVIGDAGCLSLYGSSPDEHRMISDHCVAEVAIRTTGRGRSVDEWRQKPDRPDNHLFDCLAGCSAAASLVGCTMAGIGAAPERQRKRYTQDDLRRRA